MSELYASGQLVERLAVIELELGSLSKKILKLRHDGDLGLHPDVETSQLFVQLQSYIWKDVLSVGVIRMNPSVPLLNNALEHIAGLCVGLDSR